MKHAAVITLLLALLLLCACERTAPSAPDTAPVPVSPADPVAETPVAPATPSAETADPTPPVTPVSALSGLDAALRDRGMTPEPPLPDGTYEMLTPVAELYTDARIVCLYADGRDEGVGTLLLSNAYPRPAFTMEIETRAGLLRISRGEWRDDAEPEVNGLTLALGDTICTVCPGDLLSVSVAALDGVNDYLLLADAGIDGDPALHLFRLTNGLENLGTLPDRDLRGDGAALLSGERLSCFAEDPLLTWYTLENGALTAHCAAPAALAGRTYTTQFDVYGQLPEKADTFGQSDEWIPEGERVVIEGFPGSWYNDWTLRRADGQTQHYLLWIGE